MATGGSSTTKDDEFQPSCSLCMEPYGKERPPKLLPCFHTFCLSCLTVLEASIAPVTPNDEPEGSQQTGESQAEQQADSENYTLEEETAEKAGSDDNSADVRSTRDNVTVGTSSSDITKASFLCPVCRVPAHLPEGGVAALQTNFYLNCNDVRCDACPEGNQQRAGFVCQECNKNMCPSCRRYHDNFTSGHHVTPLSHGQPERARGEKKAMCPIHQDQALCFHCRQCDISVCLYCKLTTHEGHVTSDIASVVVQAKSELPSVVTEARQQLQVVQSSLRRVEREDRLVTRHAETLTQQIKARFDLVIASVTQSRDDLLEELSERKERARSQLGFERSSTSVTVDTLSGLVSRASCASGNDVISVKKELQAALLSKDLLNHHQHQAVRQDSLPRWTYDVPDVLAVPVTACMGRVVEEGIDDVPKPLSMAELADKLGHLETDMAETRTEVTQHKAEITQNKAELTQTKAEVVQTKAEIAQTKAEVTQTKTEVRQTKAEVTKNTAEITQTKTEVTQTKAKVTQNKTDISQNTTHINAINTSVKTQPDKIAKAGTRVAFTALSVDDTKTEMYQPLVFPEVMVNEGGGYDGTTGVFTAPVAGTYIFTASVGKVDYGQSDSAMAIIMVDGDQYACLSSTYASTGSTSISVQLGMGQKVWVGAWSTPDDYDPTNSTCFIGALVQPQL